MSLALQEGVIFAGRYRVKRRIAAGAMGTVYEVVHLETERRRALKVMHPHVIESAELRERFKQEAKVAAHINSEYIVDVFDAGVDRATQVPFLVMELLQGEELGKRLKRLGRFSPVEVVTFLHQTALALDKTHRASIVHRDLKPENLFLTTREDGSPHIKVLDFGVAKVLAEGASGAVGTRSVGTPLYMAPEQFLSEAKISPATDLFAIGMIAYTLLVGQAYWTPEAVRGGNVFMFARIVGDGPRQPASVRASAYGVALPPSFDLWFARATATHHAQRFGSATQAVSALAEALGVALPGGRPMPTYGYPASMPPSSVDATPGPGQTNLNTAVPRGASQRRAAPVIGAAALGLLAAAAVWGFLFLRGRAPAPAAEVASSSERTSAPASTAPTPVAATGVASTQMEQVAAPLGTAAPSVAASPTVTPSASTVTRAGLMPRPAALAAGQPAPAQSSTPAPPEITPVPDTYLHSDVHDIGAPAAPGPAASPSPPVPKPATSAKHLKLYSRD